MRQKTRDLEMFLTLLDVTEGVRERATRDSTTESNDSTKALKERAIYTMRYLHAPRAVSTELGRNEKESVLRQFPDPGHTTAWARISARC